MRDLLIAAALAVSFVPALAADEEVRARVTLALAAASQRPAARPAEAVAKTCHCSESCTCGCNAGKPCDCPRTLAPDASGGGATLIQHQPIRYQSPTSEGGTFWIQRPAFGVPVPLVRPGLFRGGVLRGGGCAGGS